MIIARDTLVDALVARLRDDVLSGRYPPGAYLPSERELAAEYGVTRTSLKHALSRLGQLGLVETKHGVGTRVLDYLSSGGPELLPMLVVANGPDWLEEIFQTRREIGALVYAHAARRRRPEHCADLRTLHGAVAAAETADDAQLAECEIHRVLAAASGNRVYGFLVNSLLNAYLPVRQLLIAPFRDPGRAAERLTPLIDAVCAGEAEEAHAAATRYLAETERLMLGGEDR
ncbi:GntR family transcriptional regulator [Planobispora rosea]|uniref:GntR family transcriptional regulator n=1 Tax=Planobispora rosea TaxID=35762 RepID=A0A8J3S214_PLARO|nr:GntR family transcriptional regulator [Planobispora rosea]GGS70951.1 GntR family transcriptional regulator [Planobispora rosea]GIH85410.1 GntR family transcriptional regulator [Planobispora rosea]